MLRKNRITLKQLTDTLTNLFPNGKEVQLAHNYLAIP